MRWCAALAAVATLAAGQQPTVGEVLARIDRYLSDYGTRLEHVVAEETYQQRVTGGGLRLVRTLQSDYALAFVRDRAEWVGYRDTFEVDGQRVRDHDQRLQRLFAAGAINQIERINEQNAQYNLQNDRFPRTVNKPTLALELLQARYRDRFTARRVSNAAPGERWMLEFRERRRPTIVRTPEGRDQLSHVELAVDPVTGEIYRSTVSWEGVKGAIVVEYGRVDDIDVPVPLLMREQLTIGPGSDLETDATYTNYRTFQTSGRLIDP